MLILTLKCLFVQLLESEPIFIKCLFVQLLESEPVSCATFEGRWDGVIRSLLKSIDIMCEEAQKRDGNYVIDQVRPVLI